MHRITLLVRLVGVMLALSHSIPAHATGDISASNPSRFPEEACKDISHRTVAGKRRTALLIGNQSYRKKVGGVEGSLPTLSTPAQDVADLGQQLEELGFRTTVCKDLESAEITNSVRTYARKAKYEYKSEVSLFYFAGHGSVNENKSVLYGVDYLGPEDDLRAETADLDALVKMLDPDNAKSGGAAIIVVDACRDAANRGTMRPRTGALAPVTAPNGSYVVYSTAPGVPAADALGPNQKNSPFAQRLLEVVKSKSDLEIDVLFRNVRTLVKDDTGGRQIPWSSHSLTKDLKLTG
jgi:uncharacterized caspase-like protein